MTRPMNRRDSLKALLGASLGLMAGGGASLAGTAAPSTPKRGFIDAHVHVWSPDLEKYPLAPGFKKEDMNPASFTAEEFLKRIEGTGVDRVNLIQMSYYGFDNTYMLESIEKYPGTFVGTAIIDPYGKDPAGEMVELTKKGCSAFRIYPGLAQQPPATWLQPDPMERLFATASEHQLALSALINLEGLPEVDRMCDRFPDAPVVVDHLCLLGSSDRFAANEENIRSLTAMARHRNVYIKIGAFYALGNRTPPYADLLPLIRRVVEAFTPDRCLWETDCPFQLTHATYEDSLAVIRDQVDFLTSAEKEMILRGTAEKLLFRS